MGLQKFRADKLYIECPNGAKVWATNWVGGPTIALVRDCPIQGHPEIAPRTVYATDHPDTFFSIPAKCSIRKRTIKGFLTSEDGNWYFVPYAGEIYGERKYA